MGKKKKAIVKGIQTAIRRELRQQNGVDDTEDMEIENQESPAINSDGLGRRQQIYKNREEVFEDDNIKLTVCEEKFRQPQKFDLEDRVYVIRSTPKSDENQGTFPFMISSMHSLHMALKAVLLKLKKAYSNGDRMLYLVS